MKNIIYAVYALMFAAGAVSAQEFNTDISGVIAGARDVAVSVPDLTSGVTPVDKYSQYDNSQRPATQLAGSGGTYVIQGIRGEETGDYVWDWDTMSINAGQLDEAYWGYEGGHIGHSFLLFAFKKGGMVDQKGRNLKGLIVSVEAWQKHGEKYRPLTLGVQDHYPLLWDLNTWTSFADYEATYSKRPLDIYPLHITMAQKVKMLEAAIRESVMPTHEYYNTFKNSCTNRPIGLLGEATGKDFVTLKTVPIFAVEHLKAEGLISEGTTITESNLKTYEIRPSERK